MKLELDSRLRVFAALARQHSFSKAAQELSISQPAVSRHIADLENDLGILLVHRRSKDIELTPAGEYLAQYALRAEALLVQASLGLKAYTRSAPYVLHIAASVHRAIIFFHPSCPYFSKPIQKSSSTYFSVPPAWSLMRYAPTRQSWGLSAG